MAEIKAADVAKLRKMTGAGMMDCKSALQEANGDFDRAQEIIREKGKLIAAKRADRETTEGRVVAKVSADGKKGIVIALGTETDFVAKNEEFQALAQKIAETALANIPADVEALKAIKIDGVTIEELIIQMTGKTGEKHSLAYYGKIEGEYVAPYIHMNNKLAVVVAFDKLITVEAGKDVAMQIASMSPVSISKDDCPPEVIERELRIAREQVIQEGKPENMVEKIAQGKLGKFFKESTLLEQAFIKDGKISIAEYLKGVDASVKVLGFRRFSLND
ncbi:MAG: translation elongation factor Ts [Prevotellaceae bacterium]|jgi:elongation factor Ts|nr:translation elongation factor Ts [Prevotellaceae bacterium]